MIVKGIAATTHVDKQNSRIAKEALEEFVRGVNDGVYAVRVGVEHDPTIMPIGKVISGKIIELSDGEYAAEIEQEYFEEYQIYTDGSNVEWYMVNNVKDNRPFADTQMEDVKNMRISIDPANYSGFVNKNV